MTDALVDVIALLESGMSPGPAWQAAGVPVEAGIPCVPATSAGAGIVAASRLAHVTGIPLAGVLAHVDEALSRVREARDGADAALAGPRVSARILRWLPLVGLALAAAIDPGAVAMLVTTPLGWMLAAAAGVLTWAGSRWMARMVAAASAAGEVVRVRGGTECPDADPGVVVALVQAAITSGQDVPHALERVADALDGGALTRAERREGAGRSGEPAGLRALARDIRAGEGVGSTQGVVATAIARPVALAHRAGAPAGPGLRASSTRLAREARREAQRAAGELGVRLTLPLAGCLLPAFTLVGVVPMVIAVVSGADVMDGVLP